MTDRSPAPRPRTRRLAMAALVLVPLIGAAVLAVTLPRGNGQASECRAAQTVSKRLEPLARGEVAALAVHASPRPMPAVTFQGPDGRPRGTADFAGRTVLLNLWATWCAPCRKEMPDLDRLQATLGGEGFEVVAINVDTRNLDRPRTWLAENGVRNLAYYAENEGKLLQALQRSGHVVGLPTTVLIGPDGCEIGLMKGPADWASEDALALIRAALDRPSG